MTVNAPESTIDDLRGGTVIVLIKNLSGNDLFITGLSAEVSEDKGVTIRPDHATGCEPEGEGVIPCSIEPGTAAAVTESVSISALRRTGKVLATFAVSFRGSDAAGSRSGNEVVVQSLSLGIFGEAELAPIFQVPSILVLPGAAFWLLLIVAWRWGARPAKATRESFFVGPSGLDFWILAVGISALVTLVWRVLYGRNLFEGYGYRDIAGIVTTAATGAAVVAAGLLAIRVWQVRATKKQAATRIQLGDTAEQGLERLVERDANQKLALQARKYQGREWLVYDPPAEKDGAAPARPAVWGPPLVYAPVSDEKLDPEMERELQRLVAAESLTPLASYVRQLVKAHVMKVAWRGVGPIQAPEQGYEVVGTRPAIERAVDEG